MKENLSIAILAGGKSQRFGRDKAMLMFNELTLLDITYRELKSISDDIRIIGNVRKKSSIPDELFLSDMVKNRGPMGGLYTALKYFNKTVLLASCDMPFLKREHYRYLIGQMDQSKDATIARSDKGLEPLFALYQPDLIPQIERRIANKSYAMHQLINQLNVKIVDFSTSVNISYLFFNINTLRDYKKALYLREQN